MGVQKKTYSYETCWMKSGLEGMELKF